MCWYNRIRSAWLILPGCLLMALWMGCSGPSKESMKRKAYFDIKGYFDGEIQRLNEAGVEVEKQVWKNGSTDKKRMAETDWTKELSLFSESDINKPSWLSSYDAMERGDTLIYTTQDSSLKTQRMEIIKTGSTVRKISIYNRVANPLYTSETQLTYVPDSLYRMDKTQEVRFLGSNQYKIEGVIIH